jgi:hypothetical protein
VINWEEHGRIPRGPTLALFCRAFGTTEEYILYGRITRRTTADGPMKRSIELVLKSARNEIATMMGVSEESISIELKFLNNLNQNDDGC